MRGPLSAYESADKKVVAMFCRDNGIPAMEPVCREVKQHIACETGLSVRLVEKALTNIRKGYR